MGFFKKISGNIKKFAKKNIRFKNVVKIASNFDPSGIVSGMSASHEAKKEQKAYEREMANQQILPNQSYVEQVSNAPNMTYVRQNPNFGDIMLGAAGGALAGAGQVLGGSSQAGQAGSTILDNTLTTWLKSNWWKVALGLTIVGLVIYLAVRKGGSKRRKLY